MANVKSSLLDNATNQVHSWVHYPKEKQHDNPINKFFARAFRLEIFFVVVFSKPIFSFFCHHVHSYNNHEYYSTTTISTVYTFEIESIINERAKIIQLYTIVHFILHKVQYEYALSTLQFNTGNIYKHCAVLKNDFYNLGNIPCHISLLHNAKLSSP